jgi:hypothetical protein
MTWLRLQWRGALVVLAAWAGLAAAQAPQMLPQPTSPFATPCAAPAPPPPPAKAAPAKAAPAASTAPAPDAAPEKIVTITDNGKAVRCRLVQTWQLADGTIAYQFQSLETGEMMTLLDNLTSMPTAGGQSLSQRIFHWGAAPRSTASTTGPSLPSIPADLVVDSGVIITRDINPPPPGATPAPPTPIANGGTSPYRVATPSPGGITMVSGTVAGGTVAGGSVVATTFPAPPSPYCCDCAPPPGSTLVGRLLSRAAPDRGATYSPDCNCNPSTGGPPQVVAIGSCQCPPGSTIIVDPAPTPGGQPPAVIISQQRPVPSEPQRTTVFDKIQSLFRPSEGKVAAATPAQAVPNASVKPKEKSLAINTPSSARPSQAEVVTAPTKDELLTGSSKSTKIVVKAFLPAKVPDGPGPYGRPPAGIVVTKTGDPNYPMAVAKGVEKADILAAPERFNPADEKLKAKGLAVQQVGAVGAGSPVGTVGPVGAVAPRKDGQTADAAVGVRTASSGVAGLPPGAQSVLAARAGLDGPIAYVPVLPIVVPKPWRPPVPPAPQLPEAPQLNAYVNAFTPPSPPRGQDGAPMGQQSMAPYGMTPGYGPMMPGPMMSPYAPPYAMGPYAAPQPPPYGYYPPPPGYAMVPPQVMAANAQRMYQGPLPPNPFGVPSGMPGGVTLIQPVNYVEPPPYAQTVVPAAVNAAAPAPAAPVPQAPAAQIGQLFDMLRDAPYPAQREAAAKYLAACDARTNPQIADMLLEAAKQDPAPTVRAGCITNLSRMGVTSDAYRRLLAELRRDADPRVRDAVDQALGRLTPGPASARAN